jgi:adenylate cyclase
MQRRLAAILATDVVGYSRLMERDEDATLEALKADRLEVLDPAITEHAGRIVKSMGDGLLVEFADAVAAVHCAIGIQDAVRERPGAGVERLRYRIGIHIGDVIVEDTDLYGDCVNVAARLEALAQPGGICLSDRVREEIRGKIDAGCEDLGVVTVKNIARPLRVHCIRSEFGSTPAGSADAMLERPALAVLPFETVGGDAEQAQFADGLTEDLITALSLWRSFPVIARNSTSVYKGSSARVQQLTGELGVRYVVEGTVRRSGERVRISAQLIDAKTGHHLWAEKYDGNLTDIFGLIDEITERIAAAVVPELETAERRQVATKAPQSLDAWECWQRGMGYKNELTKEGFLRAREMFERAIALDPTFAQPHTWLAWLHQDDHDELFISPPEDSLARWLSEARCAIGLDRNDAWAHVALGMGLKRAGQLDEALDVLAEAVAINPSHYFAHAHLGNALCTAGRVDEGISMIEKGIRLNPRDPLRSYHMLGMLARQHLKAGHYEAAIAWARKAIHERPDFPEALVTLASSLGHLNRIAEGRSALGGCERARPGYLETFTRANATGDEHIIDGLRKCGRQVPD